jgi:hypothetical protein
MCLWSAAALLPLSVSFFYDPKNISLRQSRRTNRQPHWLGRVKDNSL